MREARKSAQKPCENPETAPPASRIAHRSTVSAPICVIFLTVDGGFSATPDSDLVARAAAGDGAAFHALVERHRAMVYRLAFQFAGNHHDAEDIAQDVFIKVYRSLERFRYDAQLTSWLYRIVMNACIDHKRRQSPAGWAPFTEEAELQMVNTPTEDPGPEDRAYGGQIGEVLESEIARLPPGQRLVFTMRHHEGLKLSEIASAAGPRGRHGETPAPRGGPSPARRA